jgi:hypothetical protein
VIWKVIETNLAKELAGKITLKYVQLPPDVTVTINIELDKAPYDLLIKDKTWLDEIHKIAKAKADKAVEHMVGQLKLGEKNVALAPSDPKAGETVGKNLTEQLKLELQNAGDEMVAEVNKLFEGYKKRKKELNKFRIKSSCKIAVSTIAIVGTAAVAAASHGTLTPFAGVAIARSTIVIGQECYKLASNCYIVAKQVTVELGILKKLIGDNSKARGTAVETGLGILSGLAGLETPSVKNCKAHIELHKINISKLEQESKKLSSSIDQVMDKAKDWENKAKEAARTLPAEKVGKVRTKMDAAEHALDKLLKATIKVNESIATAWQMQEKFEATIANLAKNVAEWTKYVDVATGALVDIAVGVGDASSAIESALSTMIAVSADAVLAAAG